VLELERGSKRENEEEKMGKCRRGKRNGETKLGKYKRGGKFFGSRK
jgi:hypothetical protein